MLKRIQFVGSLQWFGFMFSQQGLPDSAPPIDKFITVAAAVAQEVTIYRAVETIVDAPQCAITLARNRVATESAVHAHRWCRLQIPLARIVPLQCLVGKNTGRANLH